MFTQKLHAYCAHRASGVPQRDAALAAGYLATSASVTASRNEKRQDVQTEIARLKKALKAGKPILMEPPAKGGQQDRAPADDPESPLAPWALRKHYTSSLELLRDVYNNSKAPIGIRIQCAKDALPYEHARKGEGGKKANAQDDAEKVAGKGAVKKSRFATQAKPGAHLRAVK